MNRDNERLGKQRLQQSSDQAGRDSPMGMDQATPVSEKCVDRQNCTRKVIDDHLRIRNLFVLDKELVSRKERKTVNLNTSLHFKEGAFFVNLRRDNRDLIPLLVQ